MRRSRTSRALIRLGSRTLTLSSRSRRAFTFAGTDTTSNALARILHLLCLHPDAQDRLRAELLEARSQNGGRDFEYDELVSLPYLDAICRETLRL